MYGSRSTASESNQYAVGILDVDEDRVVLGRPALARLRAVVVRPDELVEEAVAPEQRVQQHLGVVRLAVVEVQVERAVVGEQPPRLDAAAARGSPSSRRTGRRTRAGRRAAARTRARGSRAARMRGTRPRMRRLRSRLRAWRRVGSPDRPDVAVSTRRSCARPVLNGGSR